MGVKNPPDAESSAGNKYHRRAPIITTEKYNQMYAAFCERQTARHVARTCQINSETANRYIEKGDPKRRLPAIRERWERTQRNAQMAEDYDIVKARREMQAVARAHLGKVAQRIRDLNPGDLDANNLARSLQSLQIVLERSLGVSDSTVTIRTDDRFSTWSTEELLEFARTGTTPVHARGGDAAIAAGAARRKANEE